MTPSPVSRVSAGVPAGGQFAAQHKSEASLALTATSPLAEHVAMTATKTSENGVWDIDNTAVEHQGVTSEGGISMTRTMLHMGGKPDWRARNAAAVATWADTHPAVDVDVDEQLADLTGKPVTALVARNDGSIEAREVKPVNYGDRMVLLKKGSSTKGWYADQLHVLAVEPGYGKQQKLADAWAEHKANETPTLAPVAHSAGYDDVPDYDGSGDQNDIAAVYVLEHPGFDGKMSGVVFLATDIQRGDGGQKGHILNGYMYVPDGQPGCSEHGSIYSGDLARWGGQVTDYKPGTLTFSDCFDLDGTPQRDVYTRLLGR